MSVAINGRPVVIASYLQEDLRNYKTPMREQFPLGEYMGGESDGLIYESVFAGGSLKQSYDMILAFLQEEGYGNIPLPKNEEELRFFRLKTRNRQVLLFEDNGYGNRKKARQQEHEEDTVHPSLLFYVCF